MGSFTDDRPWDMFRRSKRSCCRTVTKNHHALKASALLTSYSACSAGVFRRLLHLVCSLWTPLSTRNTPSLQPLFGVVSQIEFSSTNIRNWSLLFSTAAADQQTTSQDQSKEKESQDLAKEKESQDQPKEESSLNQPKEEGSQDLAKEEGSLDQSGPEESPDQPGQERSLDHLKEDGSQKRLKNATSHLVYNLPAAWFAQRMPMVERRNQMVLHLSDWAKRRCMTPTLLLKLIQGPLTPIELSRYTSQQIARIVYAIALIKKTDRLIGEPGRIQALLELLWREATDRKRLMTYDGRALAQAAFGFSMMKLDDPQLLTPFAEEGIKPHRIRNTHGKSLVNLLDSLYAANYSNKDHVEILSKAAVEHLLFLPTFAIPRLINAWGHFRYANLGHVKATLAEAIKENRLNAFLASHIEDILTACAKLKIQDPTTVTIFVRELIYSQKWKFMTHGSLPRIVWALGELNHEHPRHWLQLLNATLVPERVVSLECNHLVDIFVGWSKVSFRDSQLLDRLATEAIKEDRMTAYSTRQIFEIFKAQRKLGQLERVYAEPFIAKLKDTDKLMKCSLETKIKIFLYPNIKKSIGMKNVASLAKEIFQPQCLERWDNTVLLALANGLVPLGPRFAICFEEIVREMKKEERMQKLKTDTLCQFLSAWLKLEFENEKAVQDVIEACSEESRRRNYSEQELLKLIWLLSLLSGEQSGLALKSLFLEALARPVSVYTGKGLAMLLSCFAKHKCLDKEEIQPLVQALMQDKNLSALADSQLNELSHSLSELGFEDELGRIQTLAEKCNAVKE